MRAQQLVQLAEQLSRELALAHERIAQLEAKVAELEARLGQNSTNSHKPPSSDPPAADRPKKEPAGRSPGGQPGHPKHERRFLHPDRVIPVRPSNCSCCSHPLHGDDPSPERHQSIELPPIRPDVTDYLIHTLACPECGTATRGELPRGVASRGFGPRLTATVALLTAKYRLSKRMTQELLADLLGIDISLGSVANLEQEMSAALQAPFDEAATHVRSQPVANLDETGWWQGRLGGRADRAWLWVAVTTAVTVFRITRSRSEKVARELLGPGFNGILGTDRWSAYNWVPATLRQLCWSHLVRDFQGFVDRKGEGAVYGVSLLAATKRMFEWWHRVRDGTLSRETFKRYMVPVRSEILSLLREAAACPASKTAGMAKEMLKLQEALFTFVVHVGVDPTNNCAERAIRHAVMYRKTSFGTQCEEGSRFVERVLTVVATLRSQERSVLEFLTDSYQARLSRIAPPSLLPAKP